MPDTHNTKNFMAHGGNELVIGGKLTFLEGAEVEGFADIVAGALTPAANVPASEATSVAALKETVNALLTALKTAGFMEADTEPEPGPGDGDEEDGDGENGGGENT